MGRHALRLDTGANDVNLTSVGRGQACCAVAGGKHTALSKRNPAACAVRTRRRGIQSFGA
ncbi:hypothetical protein D3C71_2234110 [compost metagenome]